jgi:hypothetical protein
VAGLSDPAVSVTVMQAGSGSDWASAPLGWPVVAGLPSPLAVSQLVSRAAWSGFDRWWSKVAGAGFCARPIHLVGVDGAGRQHTVLARCKNRRASVCPSCSDLYAADTWQVVTAGICGGRHGMPQSIAAHPAVFVTLTAPSFGAVHGVRASASGGARRCHRPALGLGDTEDHRKTARGSAAPLYRRCVHGKPLWCSVIHDTKDNSLGQPLCAQCYDYAGHVLFSWWAPELWRRFTIAVRRGLRAELGRRGEDPDAVAVSFVKVVELQARAIPHYHTVIRLDAPATDSDGTVAPPQTSITAAELAALVQAAAHRVRLEVAAGEGRSRVLRFGEQIDTQPLSAATGTDPDGAARRVAGYLAKYVTKSVADFGLWPARISPQACASLEVSAHVRGILFSLIALAGTGTEYAPMLAWLHTLGYRGHVTTKSRRFSVTLAALRAHRQSWRADHREHIPAGLLIGDPDDPTLGHAVGEDALQTVSDWSCTAVGHVCAADYYLAVSAAVRAREYRRLARDAYRDDLGRDAHRDYLAAV